MVRAHGLMEYYGNESVDGECSDVCVPRRTSLKFRVDAGTLDEGKEKVIGQSFNGRKTSDSDKLTEWRI